MLGARSLNGSYSRAGQVLGIASMSAVLALVTTNVPSMWNAIWMLVIPLVIGVGLNSKNGCLMAVILPSVSMAVVLLVRILLPFEPPSETLAREQGVPYRTIVTRWDDPELPWRPFELEVERDRGAAANRHILFAEQCEDVGVVQTPAFLYVFYGELALTSFSSSRFYRDDPKPLLCDLSAPGCAAKRDRLLDGGAKLIKVCPSRNQDGTPGS